MKFQEIVEAKKKFADIPCPGCGDPKCDHKQDHMKEGTKCWKGYKKKGMKTMFGKRVPNCVKNEAIGEPDQYEILYKNSKGQIAKFQSGLTKQQADDKIYKLVNGIRQWGNDPSKLNFDNEKMDPQNIILKKNGQQIPLPYGNVQEVNTGNPHKGKYVIKTDEPGRKNPDIVIMPDEKAANDMASSLSKKKPNLNYWVELVEDPNYKTKAAMEKFVNSGGKIGDVNDWDNPTNDELEKERQGADQFVQDRKEQEMAKELELYIKSQKRYNYATTKRNFYAKYGPEKAERMLAAMQDKNLFI
mgnify:FL=1